MSTPESARIMSLLRLQMTIANRAAVEDIESECVAIECDEGLRWYDTRPMVDPNEHSAEVIDMMTDSLAYAEASGLIRRHAQQRHLVRILSAEA